MQYPLLGTRNAKVMWCCSHGKIEVSVCHGGEEERPSILRGTRRRHGLGANGRTECIAEGTDQSSVGGAAACKGVTLPTFNAKYHICLYPNQSTHARTSLRIPIITIRNYASRQKWCHGNSKSSSPRGVADHYTRMCTREGNHDADVHYVTVH